MAACGLVLAGCSADAGGPIAPAPAAGPSSVAAASDTGASTLPVIGGGAFDTAAFDDGPLALWFWAPG